MGTLAKSEPDDYVLRWPKAIFVAEIARLLNGRDDLDRWRERCQFLLEDCFASPAPAADFSRLAAADGNADPWDTVVAGALTSSQRWLANLLARAESLPYEGTRKPFYSERIGAKIQDGISIRTAIHEFRILVSGLESRGFLQYAFGKDCVDDPSPVSPEEIVMAHLPREGIWPIQPSLLEADHEAFCDLIEVLDDLVAAPRLKWIHSYGGCGAHYEDFSVALGRRIYRWSINRILARTSLGLELAEDGEDGGRLVQTTDGARGELLEIMTDPVRDTTGGDVPHAIAIFRSRGVRVQDKRLACVSLAGVLESRRAVLKENLLSKDEGALFTIANQFAIRHQNEGQRGQYDPIFLDWVFWFYLGAIELTDRLLARQGARETESASS